MVFTIFSVCDGVNSVDNKSSSGFSFSDVASPVVFVDKSDVTDSVLFSRDLLRPLYPRDQPKIK